VDFSDKFFGYFKQPDGQYLPYTDNNAGGAFVDPKHFAWLILAPVIAVGSYRFFRANPQKARRTVIVLSLVLITLRISFQIMKVTYGDESPFLQVLPFHQCGVMGIVLPLVVLFNLNKLKAPVYVISMMGGFATVAFGEYFTSNFVSFYTIEGMISHTLLIMIPLIEIASGKFSLQIKESWKVLVAMLILIAWASFANEVLFKKYQSNYMYLKESGFPNDFGGDYYFGIYVIIFFLVFAAIYLPPIIYRSKKSKVN
jgi:uncharacterized membrane protein YwaF